MRAYLCVYVSLCASVTWRSHTSKFFQSYPLIVWVEWMCWGYFSTYSLEHDVIEPRAQFFFMHLTDVVIHTVNTWHHPNRASTEAVIAVNACESHFHMTVKQLYLQGNRQIPILGNLKQESGNFLGGVTHCVANINGIKYSRDYAISNNVRPV